MSIPALGLVGSNEDAEALNQATSVINAAKRHHLQSELHIFDPGSGADSHCQIGNLPLTMATIFDWLQRIDIRSTRP